MRNDNLSILVRILSSCILAILCFIILSRGIKPDYSFSFTGFLDFLSNAPSISIPSLNVADIFAGDWGIFDFLRTFLSSLAEVANLLIFLANCVLHVLSFVFYFLNYIFVGFTVV